MKTSVFVKVIGLILLAVVTSQMTSVILAQIPSRTPSKARARTAPPAPPSGSTTVVGTVPVNELPHAIGPADFILGELDISRCKLEHFELTQVGRRVDISTSLFLVDRRPGWNYFWGIKLYGPRIEDGPLSVHRYLEQRFENQPGVVLNPAFAESLTLEPGNYKIKVIFYRVPPGFDARRLDKDPAADDGFGSVATVRAVTIP